MKTNQERNSAQELLRLAPVAAGCAAMLLSLGVAAQTTDAEKAKAEAEAKAKAEAAAKGQPATIEKVVVTGIRKGIEDAISVKKNSTSIVESVNAEDIGKLPDNSIAESIARLPGLAAQRVAGRAQTVSIRGLSGDFATTLLNGREQVSTGDNRAVEFDQYPSELLSGVTVYKTPDAALVGQGLSGTVDLQTVRPLEFGRRAIAVNLRGERNSLGKLNQEVGSMGNRFSASYIDQSADRRFGWSIGFAHLDSPSQVQRWEAWGYPTAGPGTTSADGKVIPEGTIRRCSTSTIRSSSKSNITAALKWVSCGVLVSCTTPSWLTASWYRASGVAQSQCCVTT
jgi:iron complex outermembrane recepter protein